MLHATRPSIVRAARTCALAVTLLAFEFGRFPLAAQEPAGGLTLITQQGRRPVQTFSVQGAEAIPLDDLAALFRLDIGEDTGERTITVNTGGGPIVLTAGQPLASVNGQLVSLDAPASRIGGRWFVPLDFISSALARIHDQRIELRGRSRLLLVGDVRVPRVSAQYRPRGRSGRLTLQITPNTAHEVSEENGRLLIRLDADAVDVVRSTQPRGSAVRTIELLDELPGFVIEPGPTYASHRIVSGESGDSTQLVVDLEAAAPAVAEARPAEPANPGTDAAPSDVPPVPDFGAPARIRTIVIDPGHGGTDEGARGPEGTLEKDVTLRVAERLRALLERRLGVRVILTRTGDTLVALDRRAAIANNDRADLFVSLHANSALRDVVTGAEVYYLSIDEYGQEARDLAERDGRYLPVSGGGVREIDMIPWEMAQARYVAPSADLAAFVSAELGRRVPLSPRPIQAAPFRVLAGANMPAILVEMGFISNPGQEGQMAQPDFQARVAEAIVAGVTRFRDHLATAPYAPSTDVSVDGIAGDRTADRNAGERD
jgi:N-acetylmuramoyl-L-alanine amidase